MTSPFAGLRRASRGAGEREFDGPDPADGLRKRSPFGPAVLRVVAAAAGGFLLDLAFAPSTWWPLAILGLALLGLSVRQQRWRPALALGLLFGLAFYLPLLNWTTVYVGPVATGLAALEAVLTAPVAILIAAGSRRSPAGHRRWVSGAIWPLWAAAAWVAGEAVRARFPFGGFPWGGIAFSQPDGPLLPAAALLGSSGLAFLTALAGFALAALLSTLAGAAVNPSAARRPWQHRVVRKPMGMLGPVLLVAAPFTVALAATSAVQTGREAPTRIVAVIQGNVPEPGLEFNARRRAVTDLHALETHRLAADVRAGKAERPDLVIWPENASDIDPYRNPDAAAVISSAVADIGVPVLVGAVVGSDTPGESYNMGIAWDPVTGPAAKLSDQTYTKRHPVPFGEYMPYRSFFRLFSAKVDLQQGAFLPGNRVGNLQIGGVPIGDVICFEVVYDDLVRDVVDGGARVLVVQTNNATFGYTNETYQQQAMSRVRAVEFGRQVLIAATSGVSAVIGPDGRVQSRLPLFTAGYLEAGVPLIAATTPGTFLGGPVEWFLTGTVLLAMLGRLTTILVRRRRARNGGGRRTADPPDNAPTVLPAPVPPPTVLSPTHFEETLQP